MTEELNGGCLDEREKVRQVASQLMQFADEYAKAAVDVNDGAYRDADCERAALFDAILASLSTSKQAGAEPVAYVPIHPRSGPLWMDTFAAGRDVSDARTNRYPFMPLFAAPGAAIAAREQEDAARYRELRDNSHPLTGRFDITEGDPPRHLYGEQLDTALASPKEAPATPQAGEVELRTSGDNPDLECIDDIIFKLECFIDHATGGKLSKSSWALETLKAAHDEYVKAREDAALAEVLEDTQPTTVQQAALWQWRRKSEPWTLEKTFTLPVVATTADSEVRTLYALLPPTTVQDRTWGAAALQEAHRLGFLRAAGWVQRDDLFADVNSPTYRKDRDHDLAQIKTAQTTALPGGNGEGE